MSLSNILNSSITPSVVVAGTAWYFNPMNIGTLGGTVDIIMGSLILGAGTYFVAEYFGYSGYGLQSGASK